MEADRERLSSPRNQTGTDPRDRALGHGHESPRSPRGQQPIVGVARSHRRGQSLVELALVLPILLVLIGAAVQYGVAFAAKTSLIQIARDTARWAATQSRYQFDPCDAAGAASPPQPVTQADAIALNSALLGYTAG